MNYFISVAIVIILSELSVFSCYVYFYLYINYIFLFGEGNTLVFLLYVPKVNVILVIRLETLTTFQKHDHKL